MFQSLFDNNDLYTQKYMRSFVARSAVSSVSFEENNVVGGGVEEYKNAMAITSYLDAYDYLFENFKETEISMYDYPKLISFITNEEYSNFRKIHIQVNGSNCPRTEPHQIPIELFALEKDYKILKEQLDNPYLLESIFHIRFLKIHPFEDGNGRCARIITCFHLLKNNLAPICIPRDKKSLYCELIEKNDFDNLAKMFEELSKTELLIMEDLYTKYHNKKI